jgi:uncharacterized protein YqgQ
MSKKMNFLKDSMSLRLLKVLEGSYRPDHYEALRLANVARFNKLYLSYLRSVKDVLGEELSREEARYRWFMNNVYEVAKVLKGFEYVFYKFRKPADHVSVDLDILISSKDIYKAVMLLREKGFEVIVYESYTITLARKGFIVDLYTQPSFAWIIYSDGERLLKEYSEEIMIDNAMARALTIEAETAVSAAHAIYKEHMVLLIDCLTIWRWMNKKVWDIAYELGIEKSVEKTIEICNLVRRGLAETPYRIDMATMLDAYIDKIFRDPLFRSTLLNILKYLVKRENIGTIIINRIKRKTY